MSWLLLIVPFVVFALVVVLGFVGCELPTQGTGDDNYAKYSFEVFNSNPVAWWRLSDPLGSADAKDEIGDKTPLGDHPGDYQGNVAPGQSPGLISGGGSRASFGGGSVVVGHDPVFEAWSFSVEAFVLLIPDTLNVTRSIVENRSATGGWALGTGPSDEHGVDGRLEARLYEGDGGQVTPANLDLPMPPVVLHVAMTYDKLANVVTLYVNGVEVISQDVLQYARNMLAPLQIGVGFLGGIQEVVVYDRPLSGEEIAKQYETSQGG